MVAEEVPVRSVARAIDLIVALEAGAQTLGALARATRLSKGTAFRILASLGPTGLVIQDPATGTYSLGPGCFGIVDAVVHGAGGLDVIAGPILERLSETTGETVAVYVRAGPQRICVAQHPSPQPIRYTARLGMENPVYVGAMGKVLLAFSDPGERDEILDRMPLVAWTTSTITDRARLEDDLATIRERGYGESRGERAPGVAAISAPVFGPDGAVVAALSVLGPEERMDDATLARFREPLLASAAQMTARLAGFGGIAASDGADSDDVDAGDGDDV